MTNDPTLSATHAENVELRRKLEMAREALEQLEMANDDLCAARSQAVYDLMDRETRDELIALDEARLNARKVLTAISTDSKEQGDVA